MAKRNAALSLAQSQERPSIEHTRRSRQTPRKRTVRLTPEDYSRFADMCKVEAGLVLEISTFEEMGHCWGTRDFMAWEAIEDVREQKTRFTLPVSRIQLAESVDVAGFRRAGRSRYELDWSVLSDDEIYPFIVWHEIGHRRDNFSMLDVAFTLDNVPDDVRASIRPLNEVLADRFAWSKVRPGEPVPLTAKGKRYQGAIEAALTRASTFFKRARHPVKPLASGQYKHVSPSMLKSKELAAFVGPSVHPEVLAHYIWKQANPLDYRSHIARQNAANPRPAPRFDPNMAKR